MSPSAEDSTKSNGSTNGSSSFTAVNGGTRPSDPSTIRVTGTTQSTSPDRQLQQQQHQSHHHHHQHQHPHHRSRTASQGSQSGSGEDDVGSDISGSNMGSPVTPSSHPDPKFLNAASRHGSLKPTASPESVTAQKRKRSNSAEAAAARADEYRREMSDASEIVHPQYHGHSMPMTNDTRMTDVEGRDELMDRHSSERIAQRASEEASKLEDLRARDSAAYEDRVAQQLQGTPQEHIRSYDPNTSPSMTPNGISRTPGQPETKRKRIFSNRTKTGCITCRRRKKKCDEGKPECNNCKRGGFVCEGYAAPINANFASMTPNPVRPLDRPPLPPLDYRQPPPPQPISAQNSMPPEPKPFGATGLPLSGPPPPQVAPIRRDTHQMPQQIPEPKPQTQPSPFSGPRIPPQPPIPQRFSSTEKERMINGELYHAFTPELIEERERCRAACWRFNNAANPTLSISREEKLRLQMEIFRPTAGTRGPQGAAWAGEMANGHLRKNLGIDNGGLSAYPVNEEPWIETPFTCDYGYNITLGPGVFINFGCTIIDTCAVTIKARTLIGPNVNIYSGTHPLNPRTRNGTKGPEFGKPVIIEEDCWIAGNVTILPGVKIGVGATVGAGSVVTRDVPPHTVVAGNPAKVIKGIMEHE